jgi:hypothetical protein
MHALRFGMIALGWGSPKSEDHYATPPNTMAKQIGSADSGPHFRGSTSPSEQISEEIK